MFLCKPGRQGDIHNRSPALSEFFYNFKHAVPLHRFKSCNLKTSKNRADLKFSLDPNSRLT